MWWASLYTDSSIRRPKLDGMDFNQLDEYQSNCLERPISDEEIKMVVWSFAGDKAPRPDGFSMDFYKAC